MIRSKKICMLGDPGVGKTSLVRRFVLGEFSDAYRATLGVNIYKYIHESAGPDGTETINLVIWDIEGAIEENRKLDSYLRGSAGTLIVGDVTRDDHAESLNAYTERFQSMQPGRPIVLAANKSDLIDGVDVKPSTGASEELAKRLGTVLLPTSAATGDGVTTLFRALAERIMTVGA